MSVSPIRWGVLGTAKIAATHVIPAIERAANASLAAVGSRSIESATALADRCGAPAAFGSYEDLIAAIDVDAIYIPLPNHLHVPWAMAALEAGKHVLCEKPLGLNTADAQQILATAGRTGRLAMEAFMYRFHPQWKVVFDWMDAGRIGELRAVSSWFSYPSNNPATNVRYRADWGGGVLMDVGCYCISSARWLFGAEPDHAEGVWHTDAETGVDVLSSGVLGFPTGHAVFTVGMEQMATQQLNAIGTRGRITVDRPFNPPADAAAAVHLDGPAGVVTVEVPPADQYALQVEAFSQAIIDGTPAPTPLADAIANMTVIDAIAASASR